jgi:hypothetical protein
VFVFLEGRGAVFGSELFELFGVVSEGVGSVRVYFGGFEVLFG